jgi:hypothetical protein
MTMQHPTAAMLKTLIPRCAVCGNDLSGHRFAQIATSIATEDNKLRLQELIGHWRRREWSALAEFQDFSPVRNAVVVYSITGPHESGMVVLIRDPFELYESAEVYLQEQLSPEAVSAISALVPARDWHAL